MTARTKHTVKQAFRHTTIVSAQGFVDHVVPERGKPCTFDAWRVHCAAGSIVRVRLKISSRAKGPSTVRVAVALEFRHGGWRSTKPGYAYCSTYTAARRLLVASVELNVRKARTNLRLDRETLRRARRLPVSAPASGIVSAR